MSDVTRILSMIESGDQKASAELLPLVYKELRKLATARMANERPDHTLRATALVHEAYLRLVEEDGQTPGWDNRGHFFAAAAEAMRRILVENARHKGSLKVGGGQQRVSLELAEGVLPRRQPDVLALSEALDRFESQDPRSAQLVKLRFFAGMTVKEAARSLGISVATAKKDWVYAKTWLHAELCDSR